jgi:hypothetical protein
MFPYYLHGRHSGRCTIATAFRKVACRDVMLQGKAELVNNLKVAQGKAKHVQPSTVGRSVKQFLYYMKEINVIHNLHPVYLRSVLILSFNQRLGLPSDLFTSVFPTKILHAFRFIHDQPPSIPSSFQ